MTFAPGMNSETEAETYREIAHERAAEVIKLRSEIERLRSDLDAADKALIAARDMLCRDPAEDDDRYWSWFNAHEDAVFSRLAATSR